MAGYLVGLDINDVAAETFSGNASTTAFTLAAAGTTNSTGVYILGIKQVPSTDYSVSGTTLTFTAAPPTGTNNISVVYTKPAIVNTPADGGVRSQYLTATKARSGHYNTFRIDIDQNSWGSFFLKVYHYHHLCAPINT